MAAARTAFALLVLGAVAAMGSEEGPLLLPTAEVVAPAPLAGIPLPTVGVLRPEAAPQATGLMLPGGGAPGSFMPGSGAPGSFMPAPLPAAPVAPGASNDPFSLKPLPGLALPGAPLLPPLPLPGMPAGFPPLLPAGAGPAGFGAAAPLMPSLFGMPAPLPGDGMMGSGGPAVVPGVTRGTEMAADAGLSTDPFAAMNSAGGSGMLGGGDVFSSSGSSAALGGNPGMGGGAGSLGMGGGSLGMMGGGGAGTAAAMRSNRIKNAAGGVQLAHGLTAVLLLVTLPALLL